ncbi:MAG: ACT domain-containing protein [Desulfovibrionales bacterium]|nr:ACT domain-containing protein [Desulfovibrionales bacterium]
MKVEQISVFLENKAGRLAEVTHTLASNAINIRALSLADTTDFGILRLIVDNSETAKSVLKDKGFTVGKTNVVAVEVVDKPGGLNHILDTLGSNNINVEYMYAFVMPGSTNATLIFRFDKTDQAVEILTANDIPIIPGTKLHA